MSNPAAVFHRPRLSLSLQTPACEIFPQAAGRRCQNTSRLCRYNSLLQPTFLNEMHIIHVLFKTKMHSHADIKNATLCNDNKNGTASDI